MELLSTLLLVVLISGLFLSFFLRLIASSPPSNRSTGFKTYPLLGSLPEFLRMRHRILDWLTEVLATVPSNTAVLTGPGKFRGVITADPSVVEYILKTNFDNFPKGEFFIRILHDFLGAGIFNSDGELWKMQRKTASFEFTTRSLRNFAMDNVTFEITSRLVPILDRACQSGIVLDLQDILERFAFDNVCKLAFDFDPACLGSDSTAGATFMAAFETAALLSSERFMTPYAFLWRFRRFLDVGSEKRLRESIATVHKFAADIIRSRMEQRSEDLLSRFIDTENASPEFLRDIVISFILAGRDTTSSALTWFFWLISVHPAVERSILAELEEVRAKNQTSVGDSYGYNELREMQYLHAAISEAMRLYPPVPVDTKSCRNGDVLPDGTAIGKGWFISYHTYAMGRMERVWGKDAAEYRPERWMESDGGWRTESPFRYPVFHGGPRMCLGKEMAYVQMKAIAASVLERYHVDVQDNDTCRQHQLSLTLRMKERSPTKSPASYSVLCHQNPITNLDSPPVGAEIFYQHQ